MAAGNTSGEVSNTDTAEQYKSERYQHTVELERRAWLGLTADEVYEKEVDFAIQAAGLKLEKDEKGLDLACGAGEHALRLSQKLQGEIDARDISETLLDEAQKKQVQDVQEGSRSQVNFALGDYGNIKESVPGKSQYKFISILGSSFMYLQKKEDYQKALNDFFGLLKPGGKLVIQFRQRPADKTPDMEKRKQWEEKFHVETFFQKASKEKGALGKFAKKGEEIHVVRNTEQGGTAVIFMKLSLVHMTTMA